MYWYPYVYFFRCLLCGKGCCSAEKLDQHWEARHGG